MQWKISKLEINDLAREIEFKIDRNFIVVASCSPEKFTHFAKYSNDTPRGTSFLNLTIVNMLFKDIQKISDHKA